MTQSTNEKIGQAGQNAKDAAAKAQDAAAQARAKVDDGVKKLGSLTHEHRDTINAKIDQVGQFATAKLGQQHAGKIAKAKALLHKGLDKLAAQRPAARAASDLKHGDVTGAAGNATDAAQDAAERL